MNKLALKILETCVLKKNSTQTAVTNIRNKRIIWNYLLFNVSYASTYIIRGDG